MVVIQPRTRRRLQARIRERFGIEVAVVDGTLRVERPRGHEFLRDLVEAFPAEVKSVTFGKPTLGGRLHSPHRAPLLGGPQTGSEA